MTKTLITGQQAVALMKNQSDLITKLQDSNAELLEAARLAIDELKESCVADGLSHTGMIDILEAAIARAEGR